MSIHDEIKEALEWLDSLPDDRPYPLDEDDFNFINKCPEWLQ